MIRIDLGQVYLFALDSLMESMGSIVIDLGQVFSILVDFNRLWLIVIDLG